LHRRRTQRADTTNRHYAGDNRGDNSGHRDNHSSNPAPGGMAGHANPDEAPADSRPSAHGPVRDASGHPEPVEHARCSPQAQLA